MLALEDLNHRDLNKNRLLKFCCVTATSTASSKGILSRWYVPSIGLSFLDVYGWGWGGGEQAPLPSAPRRDDSEPGESDDRQEDDSSGDGGGQLRRYKTFFPFVIDALAP
jgi:hypothetical protein